MREKSKNQTGINAWLQIINATLQELNKKINKILEIKNILHFLWQVYNV